jgi:ribose transport system substrate-binding protein
MQHRSLRAGRAPLASLVALAVGVCLALSACGSGDDSSSSSSSTPAPSTGASTAAATTTAAPSGLEAEVQASMQADAQFEAPGEPIDISSLKGKTVWYIPIGASVPTLQIELVGIKQAVAAAGLKLQVCDGKFNPSSIAGCLDQALNAKAGAVIADSFDQNIAPNQFSALEKAKIPAYLTNVAIGGENSPLVTWGGADQSKMMEMLARWVVVDSGGDAKTLFVQLTDAKALTDAVTDGKAVIADNCDGCTSEVVSTQTAKMPAIPSLVSSSLLRFPDTNYVVAQVDSIAAPVVKGIQQAGYTNKVKMGSLTGQIPSMQLIKSGSGQAADVAPDLTYGGWLMIDTVMRQMLGDTPKRVEPPYRLFDESNIGDVELTSDAQESGAWWNAQGFRDELKKLWTQS